MIIKSSTALRNNYGMISDLAHDEAEPIYITKNGEGDLVVMSIEAFEQREEALKLRAKLEAAEAARLSGAPTYTLEESRKPLSGHIPRDKELRNGGYRYVIAGKYICMYRLIGEEVYVYHIAHGARNYPTLFKRLLKEDCLD